jgi:hypothetical protein
VTFTPAASWHGFPHRAVMPVLTVPFDGTVTVDGPLVEVVPAAASVPKAAVAVRSPVAWAIVHVGLVPEQAPLQPVNVWPLVGVAVSVTSSPESSVHTPLVGMSQTAFGEGLEVWTEPPVVGLAAPVTVTRRAKLAVAPVSDVTFVTTQVVAPPPPPQGPCQPLNL